MKAKFVKKSIIFPNSRNSFLHLKKKTLLVIKNTGMLKKHQEVDNKLVAGLHDTPILSCKVIILWLNDTNLINIRHTRRDVWWRGGDAESSRKYLVKKGGHFLFTWPGWDGLKEFGSFQHIPPSLYKNNERSLKRCYLTLQLQQDVYEASSSNWGITCLPFWVVGLKFSLSYYW